MQQMRGVMRGYTRQLTQVWGKWARVMVNLNWQGVRGWRWCSAVIRM